MKIAAVTAFVLPLSLCAADFWVAKPFTEWSDKELQRMMDNSPWAKSVSVATGGPQDSGSTAGSRGGRSMGEVSDNPAGGTDATSGDPMSGPGGGGGRGRNRNETPSGPVPTMVLVVRWQTALPIKQAMLKMKYGAEATTSEEAKKVLESGTGLYVITVAGLGQGMLRGETDAVKKALLEQTSLSAKGKDELKPTDIQMGRAGRGMDLYFVFPKKVEFAVEDKEIEFTTKFGTINVKQKFRLKDMVFNGKLSL